MIEKKAKYKLTLGVDKEIVDSAKAAGVNISNVTEGILKLLTSRNEETDELIKTYGIFFKELTGILSKYGISVQIGERVDEVNLNHEFKIFLNEKNDIVLCYPTYPEYSSLQEIIHDVYPPNQILENLFQAILTKKEKSKKTMNELNFALKMIKALKEDDSS